MRKTFSIIFLTLFALVLSGGLSYADTVSELQAKINASNKNREALEKEIAGYQKQLDAVNKEANTLQSAVKSLDLSSAKLASEIKLTENNIYETGLDINDTGLKINDKEDEIGANERAIDNIIRQIDQSDNYSIFETILVAETISDFSNEIENVLQLQDKIKDKIITIKSIKSDLEKTKTNLVDKKTKLENYNKELSNKKLALESTKKEKNKLLAETKNTQANYAKILAEKKVLMDAFDKELASYEAELKLIIDPKSYPKSGKGILSWPVDNVIITQNFGYTKFAKTAYASGYHNGTDFGVSIGTRVKSAASGVVEGVGDTDTVCPGASFGKWVFIRYDNGLASTYGHLSLITAKAGQKVKAGDVVGYSGNTGYTTGPHLHMSVYAGQGVKVTTLKSSVCKGTYTMPIADPKAYLDPLLYL